MYEHPGADRVRERWPKVTVATPGGGVEDAFLADVDGDSVADVVSCSESLPDAAVRVSWGADGRDGLWDTTVLSSSVGVAKWMFAAASDVDGDGDLDVIVGAQKPKGTSLAWLEQPGGGGRDGGKWALHPIRDAGSVMNLFARDVDGDGDVDVIVSNRGKRDGTGVFWMENLGGGGAWAEHGVSETDDKFYLSALADLDGDSEEEILTAVAKPNRTVLVHRIGGPLAAIPATDDPAHGAPKAVAAGDVDGDGENEVVVACEGARGNATGVYYLERDAEGTWRPRDLGGAAGTKFDLVDLVDLDGDGDLDAVTSEEDDALGVIWYENPR